MHYLFEESNYLNTPVECFEYDTCRDCFPIKPHWHYFMEIICMNEGCAEMYIGDNRYVVIPGDIVLFHPEVIHSIYSADGRPLKYDVLKFDINRLNLTPSYAPKLRSIFSSAKKRNVNVHISADIASNLEIVKNFSVCIREMHTQNYGYDLIIRTQIYELLIKILRIWQIDGFSVDSQAYEEDSLCDIYSVTEYIDENIGNGTRVEDIAARCGMSYSYFAKKFLSVYGKTCKEYIEQMRIFKVEEFLVFTDFDLNYISQETGFSDCSHMIKSFKKFRGVTPKQFRLQRKVR